MANRDPARHMVFISRGEGEKRIEKKIRKSQINTERLDVVCGEFRDHSFCGHSLCLVKHVQWRNIFLVFFKCCLPVFIISLMLQLEKSCIHLVEEFRGDTDWPNREGRFNLSRFPDGSYF